MFNFSVDKPDVHSYNMYDLDRMKWKSGNDSLI